MKHLLLLTAFLATGPAAAESTFTYAGFQDREIKALSQAEIEGYLDGKGMGQAMAAELNRYPGPRHVLDLSDELDLTVSQREQTRTIFNRMHEKAVRLGARIVERERELDRLFANGDVSRQMLDSMLNELGTLKTRLRRTHLVAHLEQRAVLKDAQVETYGKLRGYAVSHEHHQRE